MDFKSVKTLREIGSLLDQGLFENIRVYNSGIVKPCVIDAQLITLDIEKEKEYEKQRSRRPKTESWTRPSRRKRKTCRPRSSHQAPQDICSDLQLMYEAGLGMVYDTYPNTQVWCQEEGLWLMTESLLLPSSCRKVKFLTWLPFIRTSPVRSWGFWDNGSSSAPVWIGPRHTNYDGTICAFEPMDNTWTAGDSILALLNYYTLWAMRHYYLQVFGRWPGDQVVHTPYERFTELKSDEYCGCENPVRLYSECCQERDQEVVKRNPKLIYYLAQGDQRKPPSVIEKFVSGCGAIPQGNMLPVILFEMYVARHRDLSRLLKLDV